MTSAFVFEADTVLCQQTSAGWSPLLIALPAIKEIVETPESRYQLGYVELQESLAPSHWQSSLASADTDTDTDAVKANIRITGDAPAMSAMTYDYALNNHIVLPKIQADTNLINPLNGTNVTDISSNDSYAFISYRQLITQLPIALANQISQAMQLLRWQNDTQFCSRCSAAVNSAKSGERSMVCSVCRLQQYPRVQPCVITAITRANPVTGETQILLAHHHRYGQTVLPLQYGLIAGFVEVGESLEHAVVREVAEEVGISLTDIRYVSSQPWPFPSNLMLGFRATYVSGDIVLQEDELSHADFFDLSDLPKIPFKGSIAYDLIAQIAQEQGVAI